MRLTETMYGRRARCIACQLKIRLPRFEEIPRGVADIFLRDHPEFIREPPQTADPAVEEQDARKRRRTSISVPIDASDTLRKLCSLEKKVSREIKAADGQSKSELEEYKARLKALRAEFNDELHQRLMEASIELTAAQEKLAELALEARVGELDYRMYSERAGRIRWRRECLERRQINLRAWRVVRDADLAGGYIDLPLSSMDELSMRVPLIEEAAEPSVLLRWMVDQLRAAFGNRKQAEINLEAASRLQEQTGDAGKEGKRAAKVQKAARARAAATIRFWQFRLERFRNDIQSDQRVIDSQLELARGRHQLGELGRDQFDSLESELRQARTDLEKALQTIDRAIAAPSDRDLPALRGTFVERLGKPRPARTRPVTVFAILGLVFMAAIVAGVIFGVWHGLIPMPWLRPGIFGPRPAHITSDAANETGQHSGSPQITIAAPAQETEAALGNDPLSEDGTAAPGAPAAGTDPSDPESLDDAVLAFEDASGEPAGGASAPKRNTVEVELRGVVTSADKAPRFFIRIHTPDGKMQERTRELGGSVAEGWIIREYNPLQQNITLFNGEDLLILRRGEKAPLPPDRGGAD
ncbi:MAG TPA: hypothetical protein PLD73_04325 [Candidatus Hydrogenedentes bacterium]|jgi:hypothetical protein|nr:hypothetical protein [Candidatus Hydrogenedentota bacterium]